MGPSEKIEGRLKNRDDHDVVYKDMIGRELIWGWKMVSENKRKCFPYFWKFLEKTF